MKNLIFTTLLAITPLLHASSGAQVITEDLSQDGLKRNITDEEIQFLMDWASNTRKELDYFNGRLDRLKKNGSDREDILSLYEKELARLVTENEGLNALQMRKFLNRALALNSSIKKVDESSRTEKFRIELFQIMVGEAEDAYESDIEFLRGTTRSEKVNLERVHGLFYMLNRLAKQKRIKDKSADILFKQMLGYVNRDFFESDYNQMNAFEINKINEILQKDGLSDYHKENLLTLSLQLKLSQDSNKLYGYQDVTVQVSNDSYTTRVSNVHQLMNWCMNNVTNYGYRVETDNVIVSLDHRAPVMGKNRNSLYSYSEYCTVVGGLAAESGLSTISPYRYEVFGTINYCKPSFFSDSCGNKIGFSFKGYSKKTIWDQCSEFYKSNLKSASRTNFKDVFDGEKFYEERAKVQTVNSFCNTVMKYTR